MRQKSVHLMPPMSNFYARICVKATPSSNTGYISGRFSDAFAMHCDREPLDGSCFGETVFIPKTEDPLLYDGKLIHMKHPTVIKVLKIGQDHAAYHIPVFIDKDRNDTAK